MAPLESLMVNYYISHCEADGDFADQTCRDWAVEKSSWIYSGCTVTLKRMQASEGVMHSIKRGVKNYSDEETK